MHLHGCSETVDGAFVGFSAIKDYGWLQYAAANDFIVIYPQSLWSFTNVEDCFDFNGMTDSG